jgi:hypothetical protein
MRSGEPQKRHEFSDKGNCPRSAEYQLHESSPRVEAGKNTSTVIAASRKRRRKGNPIVSGETVPADLTEG